MNFGSKYHKAFLWNRDFKFSEHWFNFKVLPNVIYLKSFELAYEDEVIFKIV